jgi:hypothetical protein
MNGGIPCAPDHEEASTVTILDRLIPEPDLRISPRN